MVRFAYVPITHHVLKRFLNDCIDYEHNFNGNSAFCLKIIRKWYLKIKSTIETSIFGIYLFSFVILFQYTSAMEKQHCPLCSRLGLVNFLQTYQINLDEAIVLCDNKQVRISLNK